MRYTLFILLTALLFPVSLAAQKNPKWFKKARNIQLTLITYDKQGNIQQGQAYFLNAASEILAEYNLLKDAVEAKAVDAMGQEYQIKRILGASSLYNIVKLSCSEVSKPASMPILTEALSVGSTVYIMPLNSNDKKALCIPDTISKVDVFEEGHVYYQLTTELDERLAGCPVFTESGELIGSVQTSATDKNKHGYAIAATYGNKLTIRAVDANNYDLRTLPIPKALPKDENQATTYLYLTNRQDTLAYRANLEDFIQAYPHSNTGYINMAEFEAAHKNYAAAERIYAEAFENVSEKVDEVHHSFSKLLYQYCIRPTQEKLEGWDLPHALAEAEAAYQANPLPLYLALQGMILFAQKEYAPACEKFLKMGDTNMRSSEYFLYAAQCKQMLEAPTEDILAMQDSALACYTKPYPTEAANCLYLRSKTLAELKRYREAVADLNEYEHLLSGQVSDVFYYEREQLEMQCRMYQQALNDIERAAMIAPNDPLYKAEEAVVNYRVGQIDDAIRAAQKAIELDAEFADAYRILGVCLNEKGKKAEARKSLQKAIDLGDEMAKTVLENL